MLLSSVDYHLEHLLRANVPEERIKAYSFHSSRIGFACALLAASCPYDMIQAPARWRSDRSVAIYARLNPSEYSGCVMKAMQQTTTPRKVARMPVIDAHDAIATFQSVGTLQGSGLDYSGNRTATHHQGWRRTTQAIGQQHTSPLRAGCEAFENWNWTS